MRTRSVKFFAEPGQIPDVERRIKDDVLPRFLEIPEFLGFVAHRSDGSRPEVVALSFWDDGLEGSEAVSEEFRDEIERVTGATLSRGEFDVVKSTKRSPDGAVKVDLP